MPQLPLTFVAYLAARRLRRRVPTPLLNPTLLSMVAIGVVLLAMGTRYAGYARAARPLSVLLTPPVVALAVSLYREGEILRRFAGPILLGANRRSTSSQASNQCTAPQYIGAHKSCTQRFVVTRYG